MIEQMPVKPLESLSRLLGRRATAPLWIDETVPGWMTRPELEVIARAAADVPEHGLIVEIGSFAGRSSVHWAANSRPSVEICCMDPFDFVIDDYSFEHIQGDASAVRGRPSGELFAEQTREWAGRLTMLAQRSPPPSWDRQADVIFVDGDHSAEGLHRDLQFWSDRVKPGGRLLGHDWDQQQVRDTVTAFASERALGIKVHPGTYVWELLPGHG
jgi:MMP 1-O-methyltransferase